jgi:hypothetical protein
MEEPKRVDEPYHEHNHDNAIQDSLDLTLHGDEAIDQPKQHAYYADREYNGDKWHLMPSISFSLFQRYGGIAELHCSPEMPGYNGFTVAAPRNHCRPVAFFSKKATSHDICKGMRIMELL